jgi:sialate O-acetylesterase
MNLYLAKQIPIGLVSSSWGGTKIEQWSPPSVMSSCGVSPQSYDSQLYNAMITPLLKMTIKGALWYQGESNRGAASQYACMFPAMISTWRSQWVNNGNQNFPFYFVLLAPYLGLNPFF